jgi:hypothetical protein
MVASSNESILCLGSTNASPSGFKASRWPQTINMPQDASGSGLEIQSSRNDSNWRWSIGDFCYHLTSAGSDFDQKLNISFQNSIGKPSQSFP